MTPEEAKARIPNRRLPSFWVGDGVASARRCSGLGQGVVSVIATSPGGRALRRVAYGEREAVMGRANFNSAIGGREPASYLDRAARAKPVVLLVGPVHGQETEGLTGLANLIEVMETGHDLRGRPQAALQEYGRHCRLLIIPDGNPDGLARFAPRTLQGMDADDIRFWGQGTWADGSFCGWPECKRQHPMVGPNVGFLGCYFNDAGVNPMHDEFFNPLGPEALAILKVAQSEGPEIAVSLHSHAGNPTLLRPAFVPLETQERVRDLAQDYYALCAARGLPPGQPFTAGPERGAVPAPFNLTSALYHISGTTAFTFECPHGVRGGKACQVSLEQILDIQLALYEAVLRFALARKQA